MAKIMIFGDDEDDEDVFCFEADMTVVAAASALGDDDANTGKEVLEGVLPDCSWLFVVHRRKIKQTGL